SSLLNKKTYRRGTKVVVIAKNQDGLNNLYKLVKIAHVDNYIRFPILFKSDINKYRKDLIIGASADSDSEIFTIFSTFNSNSEKNEKMKFYDYIEVRPVNCFSHLIPFSISENDLKEIIKSIIKYSEGLKIKVIAASNVHYCNKYQKKIKDIIISNPAVSGYKHYLYKYAIKENLNLLDNFESIPNQHLKSMKEIIDSWLFLNDVELIEKIVVKNQREITSEIEQIKILTFVNYPDYENSEKQIMDYCLIRLEFVFGTEIPWFAIQRLQNEWRIIKKKYISVYWLSWKVVSEAHNSGNIVGSRGSVGCSFIAYLLNITDINPLPLYSICKACKNWNLIENSERASCYDFKQVQLCEKCNEYKVFYEGHSLPFETFVGWKGEKIPDIDLNFSGEYQKKAHNYIRDLLGKDNVYRIGTVNKLSSQTAENFWEEHLKLRKKINPNFNLSIWCENFSKNNELKNTFSTTKEFIIEQLKGIKRTTGQHPGGLLIIPSKCNMTDYTPLNYPANDIKSEWLTTHFEYSFLSKIFLKMDILGHDEPTVLERLFKLTGKSPLDVRFDDEKIIKLFSECDTLGIPEFGTDLVKKNLLEKIKPVKFSQLVQISGFSHGTNVWLQNQYSLYKDKIFPIKKLLACREDILELLDEKGVDKEQAFIATESIKKGKWHSLDPKIKNEIERKLSVEDEGKHYFSILEKIEYMFPKPHAIAYTMTAWRTAYYKVYFTEEFYSVLLTYHTNIYDIWLMTFDVNKAIPLRINNLLDNIERFKSVRKDIASICRVLLRISKEVKELDEFTSAIFNKDKNYYQILGLNQEEEDFSKELLEQQYLKNLEILKSNFHNESLKDKKNSRFIEKISKEIEKVKKAYYTLFDYQKKSNYDNWLVIKEKLEKNISIREIVSSWKFTAKEKGLLFTLKIISEIKNKGYKFSVGLDFNLSNTTSFFFQKGKLLIPFFAINGIGESASKKIIEYRSKKGRIIDWKGELRSILNSNNFSQLIELENNGMIFS
ncbi:MAG TPA: hypothetical protein VN854_00610, partial [Mycoplasmatales bacterium]|nr:hypothetical protein [Mycoplasmatales bacterium]